MRYTEDQLQQIIRPLPKAKWQCNFMLDWLGERMEKFGAEYGGLELQPDFQRARVWTPEQQSRFVEALLRNNLPSSSLLLQFNVPHFDCLSTFKGDLPERMQCVDGLQRITALMEFMEDRLPVFGGIKMSDLNETSFSLKRVNYTVIVAIHSFQTRAELLQYYLDINSGGTPHTQEELERVRGLLSCT